ncbi:MlaD family protein [Prauserella flavalba]|uniref:Mammalian cell entry protein n=1 Tax=Prauserella flavalba TaxID=1477506 RepID=A0A318M3B2_9PSEU|nr:MlaD family protein [Prauserella flavalba]PXY25473.1 mammalian cell entry protein [Prauserella flavalba]
MRRLMVIALAAVAVFGVGAWSLSTDDYRVSVLLPSATNVVEGSPVLMNGFEAGEVASIRVQDGKARVELAIDADHSPLHDGAKVEVEWRALLSERHITVTDGPAGNAAIPDGGMLKGDMPAPMELDQVLAALDPETRTRLASLVRRLDGTVTGHEQDLRSTLKTSGPAVAALGDVLRGLGTDGPAIKQMVGRVNAMVQTLTARDGDLRTIVSSLSTLSAETAGQRQRLSDTLAALPGTLDTANRTLGNVPGVADKVVPLLDGLRPATERLPGVAGNLAPVLRDLRPLVGELRPTLAAADVLLDNTPGLLDSAHPAVTGLNSAVGALLPAVQFLRPYTPELAAHFSTWGSAMANYDQNSHYARLHISVSPETVNLNPGVMLPPDFTYRPYPFPGEAGRQPWTDAFGSGVR